MLLIIKFVKFGWVLLCEKNVYVRMDEIGYMLGFVLGIENIEGGGGKFYGVNIIMKGYR